MLHELLAVEGDLEGTFKKIVEETKSTFKNKPAHFLGSHRKLEMFADDDKTEYPEEHKAIDETVGSKLEYTAKPIKRYFDAVLQKEATNQTAKADLVVDGKVLAEGLPATFLLGLESRLKIVRSIYNEIPTLDPGIEWEKDEAKGKGIFKTKYPEEKLKTAQTIQHKVLYEATKEHPAQLERWQEALNVGKFIKQTWSGMISPYDKSMYLERIDKLIRAVKKARQKANTAEVVKLKIGDTLFNFIKG